MGKLFNYKGVYYGIDNGFYRIYLKRVAFGNFIGPKFKDWENLHKYIDVLIVKGIVNENFLNVYYKGYV